MNTLTTYLQFDGTNRALIFAELIVALYLLILGIVVFLHNTTSWLNRIFLLLTITVSLWLSAFTFGYLSKNPTQAQFWFTIAYFGVINISLATYIFSLVFTKNYKQKIFIIPGFIISCVWIILLVTRNPLFLNGLYSYSWGYYPKAGSYYIVFLLYFFFYATMLGVNLYRAYLKITSPLEKQVALLIFIAFLVAYTGAIDFLPTLGINLPFIRPLGFIPIAFWIVIVGYTILQYKVWNVKFVAHRTLSYFTISGIIVLSYAFIFWLFFTLIAENPNISIIILNSLLFLILSFCFVPLKNATQRFIDGIFYRGKSKYKQAITDLTAKLNQLFDLQTLTEKIFHVLLSDLSIEQVTLLMHHENLERPCFTPLKTTLASKKVNTPISSIAIEEFSHEIQKRPHGILKEEILYYPNYLSLKERALAIFQLYQAELAFPIIARDQLTGILFLGGKRNPTIYDKDIREQLGTLCSVLAVALENTHLYQEVKTVSDLKSDIIAIVSHQLRTPITNLRWGLSLLLNGSYGKLNDRQNESAEELYHATLETVAIVNRILDLSRLERGKFAFEFQTFDIIALLNEIIIEMRPMNKKKNITLSLTSPFQTLVLEGDIVRLKEVLKIFIDNSIKYSSYDKKIDITIKTDTLSKDMVLYEQKPSKRPAAVISIQDQGIGIAPGDARKLFSKFFRGKNATTFETSGLGIGLTYAKSLIDLHKGKISIKSKLNRGTTVTITLPLKQQGDY